MIHEATITYVTTDLKGNEKTAKENYIVDGYNLFADVEVKLFSEFVAYKDFDVTAIKRSKVKEIVNARSTDEDKLWMAEVQDVFVDDEGNEKYMKYKMLLYADTFDKAKAFMSEYLAQGYNMQLISIKLTSFVDVLDQ